MLLQISYFIKKTVTFMRLSNDKTTFVRLNQNPIGYEIITENKKSHS